MAKLKKAVEEAFNSSGMVFEKQVWSVEDIAKELKVSESYIYKLVSKDRIPYAKLGRLVRFYPECVYEWLSKGGTR